VELLFSSGSTHRLHLSHTLCRGERDMFQEDKTVCVPHSLMDPSSTLLKRWRQTCLSEVLGYTEAVLQANIITAIFYR